MIRIKTDYHPFSIHHSRNECYIYLYNRDGKKLYFSFKKSAKNYISLRKIYDRLVDRWHLGY